MTQNNAIKIETKSNIQEINMNVDLPEVNNIQTKIHQNRRQHIAKIRCFSGQLEFELSYRIRNV